jgi:hypothetical protein
MGTWDVETVEELRPRQGDIVIQKHSPDPFYKTDLDQVLQGLVPDPYKCYAILTGGSLSVCLYHGILGFYLRHFWTVVVTDGVYYDIKINKIDTVNNISPKITRTYSRINNCIGGYVPSDTSYNLSKFKIIVQFDNTYNSCQIEYFMQNEVTDQQGNNVITILQRSNLTVNGSDYISYNTSPNGNDFYIPGQEESLD